MSSTSIKSHLFTTLTSPHLTPPLDDDDILIWHLRRSSAGISISTCTLDTMEKREDFKRVVEGINQLEQQLLSIVEDGKMNDKCAAEAEEEVERYFSRCEQALAARKEGLLRELAQKLTAQSMSSSIFLSSPLLSFINPLHKKRRQWWMHKKRWTRPSRQGRRCWRQAHTCTR